MVIYIKKAKIKVENNIINKFFNFLKNKFCNITERQIDEDRWIFYIKNKQAKKLCKNINKKIEKKLIKRKVKNKVKVVLEEEFKDMESKLYNCEVIDGKKVQKYMIENIVKYILNEQKQSIEQSNIHIVTNTYNQDILSIIEIFLEKVKTLNIVSKEIQKYTKLQENIYDEKGIMISVSNNKKKSLKKAKIVINLDLNKEDFNKYSINREAIIINLFKEKMNYLKMFDGIVINNIDININQDIENYFKENDIYEGFSKIELYESILNTNQKLDGCIKQIIKDKITIKKLIGNNGIIDKKQILNTL